MSSAGVVALPDYAIQIDQAWKSYDGLAVLKDLSLAVPSETILAVVGNTGAGKTTLLRVMCGLTPVDRGTVRVLGEDLRTASHEAQVGIGYMPQHFTFYDGLTVRAYLGFYATLYRVPADTRRHLCDALLELVDLQDYSHELCEALSSTMQQRLSLARCLIHNPQLLLLDEPMGNLDSAGREELREMMLELSRMGKTIVITAGNMQEVADVCRQAIILESGILVAEGSVEAIVGMESLRHRVHLYLEDPGQTDHALELLRDAGYSPAARTHQPEEVVLAFPGTDEDLTELLKVLVRAGVVIRDVARDTPGPPARDGEK